MSTSFKFPDHLKINSLEGSEVSSWTKEFIKSSVKPLRCSKIPKAIFFSSPFKIFDRTCSVEGINNPLWQWGSGGGGWAWSTSLKNDGKTWMGKGVGGGWVIVCQGASCSALGRKCQGGKGGPVISQGSTWRPSPARVGATKARKWGCGGGGRGWTKQTHSIPLDQEARVAGGTIHYSCNTTRAWPGSPADLGGGWGSPGGKSRQAASPWGTDPCSAGRRAPSPTPWPVAGGRAGPRLGWGDRPPGRGALPPARPSSVLQGPLQRRRRPAPGTLGAAAARSASRPPGPGAPSPDPGPDATEEATEEAGSRGPHQAELANLVVGHEAEDVLDGYDGQRHQCVVLRQVVRSQRGRRGRLGPRRRGLRRGRRGLSLSGAGGRAGAAVAVAAASFLSHPLLRRRHLGSLIPSSTVRGPGHFLCVTSSFCLLRGAGRGAGGACGVTRVTGGRRGESSPESLLGRRARRLTPQERRPL